MSYNFIINFCTVSQYRTEGDTAVSPSEAYWVVELFLPSKPVCSVTVPLSSFSDSTELEIGSTVSISNSFKLLSWQSTCDHNNRIGYYDHTH